jgi:hypothetical protein
MAISQFLSVLASMDLAAKKNTKTSLAVEV